MIYWDTWIILSSAVWLIILLAVGYSVALPLRWTLAIWITHLVTGLYYANFVIEGGGDAMQYYVRSFNEWAPFKLGTYAIVHLAAIFSRGLGMGFVATSLVVGFTGAVGIQLVVASIRERFPEVSQDRLGKCLLIYLTLSPSYHFWSCALGKDSLSVLACGLFVRGMLYQKVRWTLILIAFAIVGAIRPHIAAVFTIALIGQALLGSNQSSGRRLSILLGVVLIATVSLPPALEYAGGIESLDDAQSVMEDRQSRNLAGGSSYDLAAANPVWRVVTYAFRPFVWEAKNVQGMVSAVDNAIILGLFIALFARWRQRKSDPIFQNAGLLVFGTVGILVFANATANMGIAVRQKWMFLPALLSSLTSILDYSYKRKVMRR